MKQTLPEDLLNQSISWRHALHTIPEPSGEEHETARMIFDTLLGFKPQKLVTGLGGTGVAAVFRGPAPGKSVLLRCELDGLPITESIPRQYSSKHKGMGHQCGHDGHMAILLAVGSVLERTPLERGEIILLFQPAEENGAGARSVIADPKFGDLKPDYSLALHNLPGHPSAQVVLKSGCANCASRGLRIRLLGKTAHASTPETGLSPARAMTACIEELAALSSSAAPDPFALVTIVHAQLGEPAFGVAPGFAEVWVTLRTEDDRDMATLVQKAEAVANRTGAEDGLEVELTYDDIFSACHNDGALIEVLRHTAESLDLATSDLEEPMRASEDFGEFARNAPAAMFFLGSGKSHPALHDPEYDFPDELIAPAVQMFLGAASRLI